MQCTLEYDSRIAKYWKKDWAATTSAGICWNLIMVAGVRNAVPLFATSPAASATLRAMKRRSNSAAYKFSDPGRFNRPAILMTRSLSRYVETMYGASFCPLIITRRICLFLTVTQKIAPDDCCEQVPKTASLTILCQYNCFPLWMSNN